MDEIEQWTPKQLFLASGTEQPQARVVDEDEDAVLMDMDRIRRQLYELPIANFRFRQCELGALVIIDVDHRRRQVDRSFRTILDRLAPGVKPAIFAGLRAQAILDVVRNMALDMRFHELDDVVALVRMQQSAPPEQRIFPFIVPIAQDLLELRGHVGLAVAGLPIPTYAAGRREVEALAGQQQLDFEPLGCSPVVGDMTKASQCTG